MNDQTTKREIYMKKIISVFLALSLVIVSAISVFAGGNVIGIYTYGANDGSNFLGDDSSYLNKATRITDDVISFYNNH